MKAIAWWLGNSARVSVSHRMLGGEADSPGGIAEGEVT
jgi:hypothetical protein